MSRSPARILAVAMLAAACSRAKPVVAPAPPPPPFPASFVYTARTSADSIEASFEGTATYSSGWITVSVSRSVITLPPGNPENWRNLTVRAFLATDYRPGDWKAVAQSRPVNVFRFLNFSNRDKWAQRQALALEQPLSFVVPVPPGATAATSRLAFEIEWVYLMGAYGDTESRIAFSGPISATPPFP
jgi:hypothetical protein